MTANEVARPLALSLANKPPLLSRGNEFFSLRNGEKDHLRRERRSFPLQVLPRLRAFPSVETGVRELGRRCEGTLGSGSYVISLGLAMGFHPDFHLL